MSDNEEVEEGEEFEPRFKSGVIRAYRYWKMAGALISITSGEVWPGYERLEAHHDLLGSMMQDEHTEEAPCSGELHCGIYAMKTPLGLVDHRTTPVPGNGNVWGEVKLWGKIIEHDFGYRAQYAYPSWIMCEHEWQADIIREMYGVKTYIAGNVSKQSDPTNNNGGSSQVTIVNNAPSPATVNYDCTIQFINGYPSAPSFQYNGAADPATIAKWFEGILPHYMTLNGGIYSHQFQIQLRKR